MIMQSIANMRTLNRELRKEAQEERQLEVANKSGNLLEVKGSEPKKPPSKQKLHKTGSKHDGMKRHEIKKVKKDEKPGQTGKEKNDKEKIDKEKVEKENKK